MRDDTGREFTATVVRATPVAGGMMEYELEVPTETGEGISFVPLDKANDEACPEKRFVETRVEQCILERGHLGQAPLSEPFVTLADPTLPDRLDAVQPSKTAARSGGGSNEALLVGAPGFEPGTSPTRTVRATRLRHAPK
jgi:hypothetical protein